MPWRVTSLMDQKLSFIKACVDGSQSLSSLCRDYGISRKTGYKWLNRYNEIGLAGLRDGRSLRLERGSRFDDEIWGHILSLKKDQPTWGPEKVHHWLKRHLSGVDIPSSGTIKAYFIRHGLSGKRKCWISRQSPTEALAAVAAPGDTWCIDFKGWYRSRDGRSCQPLTLTDAYSRFLLLCRQSPHSRFEDIQPLLVKAFEEYGCPLRIRSDNGAPFGSSGWRSLSGLSVWLIKHGIFPEKISRGRPQENGSHERFHRTLNEDVIKLSREYEWSYQNGNFERFRYIYNYERPHQALGQRCPGDIYKHPGREFNLEVESYYYPEGWRVIKVDRNGYIKFWDKRYYLSESLIKEEVGLTNEENPQIWFRDYYLGELQDLSKRSRSR